MAWGDRFYRKAKEKVEARTGVVKRFHLAGADGSAIGFEMNRVGFTTKFADDLTTALSRSS